MIYFARDFLLDRLIALVLQRLGMSTTEAHHGRVPESHPWQTAVLALPAFAGLAYLAWHEWRMQ